MTNTSAPQFERRPLDADVVEMLDGSLRHVLTDPSPTPLTERLEELGWGEVVADNPPAALGLLFDLKGRTLSPADALGPQLAARLAELSGDPSLAGIGVTLESPLGPSVLADGGLSVDALMLSAAAHTSAAVLVADRLAIVPTARLGVSPLHGVDDSLALGRLTGVVAEGDIRWIDADITAAVVAHGRRLLACELAGIAAHVVSIAVAYTKDRIQYGKPIGVFQALQHRLAAAHSLTTGAGHLCEEAGVAGDPWSALVAKCVAGQAAENACTQAQQCFGAIGFTWEHEFHRYLRRAYTLDHLLGDWRSLEFEIGEQLQATGVVPRIGTL
jgi:hypothetical protein